MLTAVVLAAGEGRRFGAPKLLLPAGPGEVLLTRAVRLALTSARRVLVILPQDAGLHRRVLSGIEVGRRTLLVNPDAERGLGTSLALAAQAVFPTGDDLLVLPADLPALEALDLRHLAEAFARCRDCAAAAAQGAIGQAQAPAVLGNALLADLTSLDADIGARAILRRAGARVTLVQMTAAAEDVDDFAAYRRVARRLGWDREPPSDVMWRDRLQGPAVDPAAGAWRTGQSLAALAPSQEPGLTGYRGPGLPPGVRRILFGGVTVDERLQLLRTATLLSLRDENA